MKVTIAATRSNDPEVHAAGCADVKRGLRSGKYMSADDAEVASRMAAAEWFWDSIIDESDLSTPEDYRDIHTRFLPCVVGLPDGEHVAA